MPDEQTPTHTLRNSFAKSPRMNFGRSGGRQSMVMLIWSNLYANCLHFWVRGFNFPAHRNLRVSEGVENLLR